MTIPFIKNRQLYVNGKPFLVRGAELQNSSMSSAAYMKPIWPKLKSYHLNTVIGTCAWDQVEPEEGKFDFSQFDQCVRDAEANGLKLIVLWLGAFKNGMSTYAPSWVKTNLTRFPRAKIRPNEGAGLKQIEVMSLFKQEIWDADCKAFVEFMNHLKSNDPNNTVIMVQLENEVGLLGDSMDRICAAVDEYTTTSMPKSILELLKDSKNTLHSTLKTNLMGANLIPGVTWKDAFQNSLRGEEIFMAYKYASYIQYIVQAARKVTDLPIYTNVWQNNLGSALAASGGEVPGAYPSGGAVSNVLDIWFSEASSLDFIAPDIYLKNEYDERCQWYCHKNQPLFIPEQSRDAAGARRMWRALGTYGAIGACPFGIDTMESPYVKHWELLSSVESTVLTTQLNPQSMIGIFFDEQDSNATSKQGNYVEEHIYIFEKYKATIQRYQVFGRPGPAPEPGYGLIIQEGPDQFLVVGAGFQVLFEPLNNDDPEIIHGILRVEELQATNEGFETLRWLNGDETQAGQRVAMPYDADDFVAYPDALTIPANTRIARAFLYTTA